MADTVWASSNEAKIYAPTIEKIALGWQDKEFPPNEWFNWLQNRTDVRLNGLESPVAMTETRSAAGTRSGSIGKDISGKVEYTVPEYQVGARQLQVYLDGVLCINGETYSENGNAGTYSTTITWLETIDTTYDILCRAPIRGSENQTYIDDYLEDRVEAYVNSSFAAGLQSRVEEYVAAALEASGSGSGSEGSGSEGSDGSGN